VDVPDHLAEIGARGTFGDRRAQPLPGRGELREIGRVGASLLTGADQWQYITLALGSAFAIFLYPHALTGIITTRNRAVVKRTLAALPIYSFVPGLIALFGVMAIAGHIAPLTGPNGKPDTNTVVPSLFQHMFPSGFTGLAFAMIVIGALVPAAFMQDILGIGPPYPLLSVPVVTGTAGGLSMIAGCAGLTVLKRHADPEPRAADYGLLIALGLLAFTGMLTLLLRATPAYGLVLMAHLTTIVICFGIVPYTRFVHSVYRFLAIAADNIESRRTG
jgi:hypothetical protein